MQRRRIFQRVRVNCVLSILAVSCSKKSPHTFERQYYEFLEVHVLQRLFRKRLRLSYFSLRVMGITFFESDPRRCLHICIVDLNLFLGDVDLSDRINMDQWLSCFVSVLPIYAPKQFNLNQRGQAKTSPQKGPLASSSVRVAELSAKAVPRTSIGKRAHGEAPIELSILQYSSSSSNAADMIPTFPEEKLWQIQIRHEGCPSITGNLVASINSFLTDMHQTNASMPASLQQLRADNAILIQLSSTEDPMQIGLQQWRVAVYAGGDLEALQDALGTPSSFFAEASLMMR